jgi:hypothetical protein
MAVDTARLLPSFETARAEEARPSSGRGVRLFDVIETREAPTW